MNNLLTELESMSQIKDMKVIKRTSGETDIYILENEYIPADYLCFLKNKDQSADKINLFKVSEDEFCSISDYLGTSLEDMADKVKALGEKVFLEKEYTVDESTVCIPELEKYKVNFVKKASNKKAICHGRGDISAELEKYMNGDLSQFLFNAAKTEQKIVFIKGDGSEVEETYAELLKKAEKIALNVRNLPFKKHRVLMFQFTDNQDFIETFWGCVLSGVVPVPVQTCACYETADAGVSRVYNIWQILGEPPVIATDSLYGSIISINDVYNEKIQIFPFSLLLRESDEQFEHSPAGIEDLALVMFTSGSTGLPKGVKLSHFNLISQVIGQVDLNGFNSDDISMNWMPLTHVGGIIYFHLRDVYLKALQVHVDTDLVLKNPLSWLDIIDDYRACITWSPNFAYKLIVDALERGDAHREWDLSCMHTFLDGGEAVIAEVGLAFLRELKPYGLKPTAFVPSYGMSETSSGVIYYFGFNEENISPADTFVPVGEIIPGDSIRIADENDQLKYEGEIGRFQVKGNTITRGYFNNEKATEESYTEDGWFNTGDLAYIKDGMLAITGREKDVIIINGVNYYNHEIESELETLPEIKSSFCVAGAVTVAPGTPEKLLILYSPEEFTDDQLVEHSDDTMLYISGINEKIRRSLAKNFNLFPHDVVCIPSFEVLKTDIGKLQRKKMIELYLHGSYNRYSDSDNDSPSFDEEKKKPVMTRSWREKRDIYTPEYKQPVYIAGKVRESLRKAVSEAYKDVIIDENLKISNNTDKCSVILDLGTEEGIRDKISRLQETVRSIEKSDTVNILLNVFTEHAYYVCKGDTVNENAVLNGLLKSYQMENNNIFIKQIDVCEDELSDCTEEIIRRGDHVTAFRKGKRMIPYLVSAEAEDVTVTDPMVNGGLYLVTGITGGAGRKIISYICSTYNCRIIAVGRKTEAEAEKIFCEENFKDHVAGYRNISLTDKEKLHEFVEEYEKKTGLQLSGIIHFAGSVSEVRTGRDHWSEFREHFFTNETMQSFDKVFETKVYAVPVLYSLLEGRPECRLVMISSVNAFFGGSSLSAYSAGSSYLNEMALSYMSDNKNVYCISYANISGVGMSANIPEGLKESSVKNGFYLLTLEEVTGVLMYVLEHRINDSFYGVNMMNTGMQRYIGNQMKDLMIIYQEGKYGEETFSSLFDDNTAVVTGRLSEYEKRISSLHSQMPYFEEWKETLRNKGMFSSSARMIKPATETEKVIYEIWKEVLRIGEFSTDKSYFTIGGNSLNSFRTLEKMNQHFGTDLTIADFFTYNSVKEFAAFLEEREKQDEDEMF